MNPIDTLLTENLKTDILIVGGGGAGLAAAVAAAEKGASKIVVLEERHVIGGNAVFPDGIFAAESPVQKRLCLDVRKDDIFKKAMDYAHWKINPRLIRALVNKSGDTIRWLEEKGVEFEKVAPIYPNNVPVTFHITRGPGKTGAAVVRAIFKSCEDLGIHIRYRNKAKKLLVNETGNVIGVLAEQKNHEIKIFAKSVILATGGFTGNIELLKNFLPSYNHDEINHTGMLRNGDGLQMAVEIGAATEDMLALELLGPFIESKYLINIVRSPQMVWVNKCGERFAKEDITFLFTEAANSIYRQPGKISYILFDKNLKQRIIQNINNGQNTRTVASSDQGWANRVNKELNLQAYNGEVKISNSWEEIAKWIEVKSEVLQSTIDQYNAFCDRGYDEDFLKDKQYLLPLHTPPFYAIRCRIDCVATHGGVKITHRMEVLDCQDNPIKGLYAAGVEIGGTESDTYNVNYPGHSFGFTINSGRIAGESAAEYVLANKSA